MHKLKLSLLVLAITGVTAGALFTAYTPSNEVYKPTVKADAPTYSFSFDAGNRLYEGVEASNKGTINKTSSTGGIVSFQYEGISKKEGVFQVLNAGAYIENHFVSGEYHNRISTITSITYNNASAADLKLYFGEGYEDAVVWKSSSSLESGSHTVTAGAGISFVRIVNETASPINLVSFSINYSCVPPSFTHLANYSGNSLTGFTSKPANNYELVIPKEVGGNSITTVAKNACFGHTSLTRLVFPSSMTDVAASAFYSCTSLTQVTLNNGLTALNGYCFSYCSSLTTITLPATITGIGDYAFEGCDALSSLKFEGTVAQWKAIKRYGTPFPDTLVSITCTDGSVAPLAK